MITLTRPLILSLLRLVTGVIEGVAKLIFIVIDKLHLKFLAFYLLVGLIVWLAGGMPKGGWFIIAYFIGLALIVIYWFYRFFTAPLRYLKRKKKPSASGSEVQIVPLSTEGAGQSPVVEQQPSPDVCPDSAPVSPVRPRYFRVRQNPKYVMAEYPDRYELFYERKAGDWQYVRTDYKNYGENE